MNQNESLKWIYKYCQKYLLQVFLLAVISSSISLAFVALALLSRQVIDIATGKLSGNIWWYCFWLIATIALQALLNIVSSTIRVRVSGKIEMTIKQQVFHCLVGKELTQLNTYHSGEYMNRLTSDIAIVVDGVVSIVPQAVSMVVKLSFGLAVLLSMDAVFTLILIACGLFVFLISWVYRKKFKDLHQQVQQSDGKTRSFMQECIENMIVIKSFTSEKPIISRLKALQKDHYDWKIKRNSMSNLANTGVYVLFSSGYYFTLIWGALKLSTGSMTFGALTAFLQILEQVKAPFRNISGLIPQYFSMLASAQRLEELEKLNDEVAVKDSVDMEALYQNMQSVTFEHISFSYDQEAVLADLSVSMDKGKLTAIVGSSGAGKSTLIKLLLGFITAQKGEVYIKTADKKYTVDASMRPLFSYVPQGNMILSGTIRENITFFNDEIGQQQVIEAAVAACVMDFVAELPQGLDTIIGERGIGLSEGQVQRIAIARALISKAPIVLLDEATSALDAVTEQKLLKHLKDMKNKTCIFISHREATIAQCDSVIKIESNMRG